MASRAKVKVYGKKKGYNLVESLQNLRLTPSPQCRKGMLLFFSNLAGEVLTDLIEKGTERHALGELPDNIVTLPKLQADRPLTEEIKETRAEQLEKNVVRAKRRQHEPELFALTSLECVDSRVLGFGAYYHQWLDTFDIKKIAQGSYAAILRMQVKDKPNLYTIWKLMPLKPSKGKGSRQEGQTLIQDAATEAKALAAMSQSPGFVEFRSAQVLRGSLPLELCSTYEEWERTLPEEILEESKTRMDFPDEQLWLFIEMTDAGTDLEVLLKERSSDKSILAQRGRLTAYETWDIFWGIANALAHGEAHAEFEHRDLHPGNVCIKKTGRPSSKDHSPSVKKYTDLEVTLIDYTLSRAKLEDGTVLANSMRDKGLFEQSSEDQHDGMQYEIYRHMRTWMIGQQKARPAQEEKEWRMFLPMTNIMWLSHLLRILLDKTAKRVAGEEGILARGLEEIGSKLQMEDLHGWELCSATELIEYEIRLDMDEG